MDEPTPEKRTALITGASAGIGAAFARALAARGLDLILTARRTDRLEALAADLRNRHGVAVTVLTSDLAAPDAAAHLVEAIAARGLQVDWLVNNAGYGVPGAFDGNPWPVHADFLRVLMEAPTELAWRLLPGMRTRGYGRILNIASLAGHVPGTAGHTLYAASKAYMIKFSQSLAMENADAGVHVCALCPGFTRSEFHDVTGTRPMMDKLPAYLWQTAEAVVEEGIAAVEKGAPVHVTGWLNRAIKTVVTLLPDWLALILASREAKRYRRAAR
jgi:short-subunit dehydrogenase